MDVDTRYFVQVIGRHPRLIIYRDSEWLLDEIRQRRGSSYLKMDMQTILGKVPH